MSLIYTTIYNEQGEEKFSCFNFSWNITKLLNFLNSNEYLESHLYRLNKAQYEKLIINEQSVNESKIDNVDISKPIIVAIIGKTHIFIDGIHRIRKAYKNNSEYVYAYMLPIEEHARFLSSRADFNNVMEFKEQITLT